MPAVPARYELLHNPPQRRPAAVVAHFSALRPGDAALSVINYGELARGVEKSADPQAGMLFSANSSN